MASRKTSDPARIAFLTDSYEREKWLRMHWTEEHMGKLKRATVMDREPTNYTEADIAKALITSCMSSLSRCAAEGAGNKRTVAAKVSFVKVDNNMEIEPTMKPITEEQRAALFESRKAYLKLRCKIPSHKKYNFVECTNMEYGWNLDVKQIRPPVHGKVLSLRMKGVGPQPDPKHYRHCPITYCKEI
ncbi:unnamed protein product [Chrysodeixis includens]|uniref:Sperm microtubule inner protein 1 C-terminal domain-containing protein n=1 Tax=Chrysodeixis includens TaxID=689277 RepID=A0A9P0FV54_CHRIL|nr:unnamed protein product [Chrysodeixis includens]